MNRIRNAYAEIINNLIKNIGKQVGVIVWSRDIPPLLKLLESDKF